MLVVFANNQVILAPASGSVTITTDPVALNGNNQATGVTNVHAIENPNTGVSWIMEGSNDGQTWVTLGPSEAGISTATAKLQPKTAINTVYARLAISFDATGGLGFAIFDIHVNFDHS